MKPEPDPGLGHFPAVAGTFYWEPEPQRELLYFPGAGTVKKSGCILAQNKRRTFHVLRCCPGNNCICYAGTSGLSRHSQITWREHGANSACWQLHPLTPARGRTVVTTARPGLWPVSVREYFGPRGQTSSPGSRQGRLQFARWTTGGRVVARGSSVVPRGAVVTSAGCWRW